MSTATKTKSKQTKKTSKKTKPKTGTKNYIYWVHADAESSKDAGVVGPIISYKTMESVGKWLNSDKARSYWENLEDDPDTGDVVNPDDYTFQVVQNAKELPLVDPCRWCGLSTRTGGRFINRIGYSDQNSEGWACAECAGFECDECNKQIYLDTEVRVTEDGGWANYHTDCYNKTKHGIAEYGVEEEE